MRSSLRVGLASLVGTLVVAVASAGAGAPPEPEWSDAASREAEQLEDGLAALPAAPTGAVRVHLAFGSRADLDLYVTGPLEETVYHANTPSAIGGELVADRHCEEGAAEPPATPRVETIQFAPAHPGHYRVGVDYPHACRGDAGPVPFVLRIDTPDGRRTQRGLASFEFFELAVLEFDVPPQEKPHAP
jgi:hypothetical protein